LVALGALALITAVVAIVLQVAAVSDLREAARRDRRLVESLQRRANQQDAAASGLSLRVGSLEAKAKAQRDPADIARQVEPSVFTIETPQGLGSGFVFAGDAAGSRLVTNFHVVADLWMSGGRRVKVRQEDRTYNGTITKVNEASDLAFVSVATQFPALVAAAAKPAVGDPVLVVGSPLGLGGTVASGIVSAFRTEGGQDYVQFSAPISPGNSGGPVVDRDGHVVGVAVAKLVTDGAEGLSFAIPVSEVCSSLGGC